MACLAGGNPDKVEKSSIPTRPGLLKQTEEAAVSLGEDGMMMVTDDDGGGVEMNSILQFTNLVLRFCRQRASLRVEGKPRAPCGHRLGTFHAWV